MRRLPNALMLVALVGTSCSGGAASSPAPSLGADGIGLALSSIQRAPATHADAEAAAAAINGFGVDLYHALAADADNLVFSPTSIAIALGMARAGASGDTAAEMDAVLGEVATDEHGNWLNSLSQTLSHRSGTFDDFKGDSADVSLNLANATFAQAGFPLEQAYLDTMALRFGAGLQLVDFVADTEAARLAINGWVASETEERIPELLAPGILNELSRLALVNAIYLKAQWHTPFDDHATGDAPFTTAEGATVEVPTMVTDTELRYGEGAGWRTVELPYAGGELAMMIVVPDDLDAFEDKLDGDILAAVAGSLRDRQVSLLLPRFGIETKANLNDILAALGMPTAFDMELADFSGISPEFDGPYGRLSIQSVIHQANIDVDEYGTEAAAATGVIIGFQSGGPPDQVSLHVDRPFIFAIRDIQTGAVLFLGRVTDPSISP